MNFFDQASLRLKQHLGLTQDKDVAAALGISARAWAGRKDRDNFPSTELRLLAAQRPELGLDVDWIVTGSSAYLTTMTKIAATLTRDRHGAPLVELQGGPFNGLATSPAALRALAAHLDALARLAAGQPTGGKHYRPMVVTVGDAQPLNTTTQTKGI